MARGDKIFARTEVDWPEDPRCLALKDSAAKWLFHVAWLVAVAERRELLTDHWSIAALCEKARAPEKAGEVLLASPLIEVVKGRIRVVGVRRMHAKLDWKADDPYKDEKKVTHTGPIRGEKGPKRGDTGPRGRGRERGKGEEKQGKKEAPPVFDQIKDRWNEVAEKIGSRKIHGIHKKRAEHLNARLKDKYWVEGWRGSLDKLAQAEERSFVRGNNDRGWHADFKWWIRPDTVMEINEGLLEEWGKERKRKPGDPRRQDAGSKFDNV